MIRVTQQAAINADTNSLAHHYSLGGQRVVFQSPVESLSAFSEGPASDQFSEMVWALTAPTLLDASNATLQYEGLGLFDGKQQEIRSWTQDQLFQIDVAGQPLCSIDLRNKHIRLMSSAGFDERLNLEVVTGPAMMLALAEQEIYTLHAGAVVCSKGAVAFVAESGTGKSTLSADASPSWRQYADDMLPLIRQENANDEPAEYLLQSYPQLKLPNAISPYQPDEKVPLRVLIRLTSKPVENIQFRKLEKTEALLEIVRHTVAAKLFNYDMMRNHVRFAKRLSSTVTVLELSYPRDLAQLNHLRAAVMTYVNSI